MRFLSRPEEFILLAIWKLEDEAYCVSIRRLVSQITQKNWSFGAVYVPLSRLEKKGFIKSQLDDPQPKRGGRSRRIYQLSKAGIQELIKIRETQKAMWDLMPQTNQITLKGEK